MPSRPIATRSPSLCAALGRTISLSSTAGVVVSNVTFALWSFPAPSSSVRTIRPVPTMLAKASYICLASWMSRIGCHRVVSGVQSSMRQVHLGVQLYSTLNTLRNASGQRVCLTGFPSQFHTVPSTYLTLIFVEGRVCPSRTYATDVHRNSAVGLAILGVLVYCTTTYLHLHMLHSHAIWSLQDDRKIRRVYAQYKTQNKFQMAKPSSITV